MPETPSTFNVGGKEFTVKKLRRTRITLFDPIDVPDGEEIEIIMMDSDQPDFSLNANFSDDDIDMHFPYLDRCLYVRLLQ